MSHSRIGAAMRDSAALVAGVALRVAAFRCLGTDTFSLRVGLSSEEQDLRAVCDAASGLPVSGGNVLWAAARWAHAEAGDEAFQTWLLPLLLVVADAVGAWALHRRAGLPWCVWWLNPVVALSCALSVSNVFAALMAWVLVLFASDGGGSGRGGGNTPLSLVLLSVATYLNPQTGLTVAAVLLYSLHGSHARRARLAALYAACVGAMSVWGVLQGDEWNTLTCVGSRPNWGFHWYLHLEVFDSFRDVFCHIMLLFTPGMAFAFAYKLLSEKTDTVAVTVASAYALSTATALCPTFVDYTTSLALLYAASPATLTRMKTPLMVYVWAGSLSFILGHCFLEAWLKHQSANANFYYFVTLAWGFTVCAYTIEYCGTHALAAREQAKEKKKSD
eukprot:Rhum_TRINITY_DN6549_c0_g1::Rhum_TRINITY_DN6549_c0_g1_i1::g.20399::m.20399/K05293/PIGU; phosphatidylinositol glycan, class U